MSEEPHQQSDFASLAREAGVCLLALRAGQRVRIVQLEGSPQALDLDLSDANLFSALQAFPFDQRLLLDSLLPLAGQAIQWGVERRQEGEFADAYLFYRFALFVAVLLEEHDGFYPILKNIWALREVIKETTRRGGGPRRNPEASTEEIEELRAYFTGLEATEQKISEDSKTVWPRLSSVHSAENFPDLRTLATLRLAADLAENSAARSNFMTLLLQRSKTTEERALVAISAIEEMLTAELTDVLFLLKITDQRDQDHGERLSETWEFLSALNHKFVPEAYLTDFNQACMFAFNHFSYIRVYATTAGGAFGHRISYAVTQLVQYFGRNVSACSMRLDQPASALFLAEQSKARAMADWMTRTHLIPLSRVPHQFMAANHSLSGSINAVEPASLKELQAATRANNCSMLFYFGDFTGYSVWLQKPDGTLIPGKIDAPQPLLNHLFTNLPYLSSNKLPSPFSTEEKSLVDLDNVLQQLYELLLPPAIRDALKTEKRLAIVTDTVLDFVPFCALKSPEGQFLVESLELSYWPSATAWLITESTARTMKNPSNQRVVLGKSEFPESYTVSLAGKPAVVKFPPLPGVAEEVRTVASILNVEPRLDSDATISTLISLPSELSVLHIATHGFLNEPNPEESFLALSDGTLSASFLYGYDPGIRTNLVVMSACQTGLGEPYLDSMIGLANAFLIAGANTVVSTLWQIPDLETKELMADFYRELMSLDNVASCLRKAQVAMLSQERARNPLYWAAFKVTGNTLNPLAY